MSEDDTIESIRRRFAFHEWEGINRLRASLFIDGYDFNDIELEEWRLLRANDLPQPLRGQSSLWRNESDPNAVIRIDFYDMDSRNNAHERLADVLSQFESPLVSRDSGGKNIGDVLFAHNNQGSLVFARGNILFMIASVGPVQVPVEPIAQMLDEVLISEPDEAPRAARAIAPGEEMGSEPVTKSTRVNTRQPLYRSRKRGLRRVFCRGGEIERSNDEIVLAPSEPGRADVVIFDSNEAAPNRMRWAVKE